MTCSASCGNFVRDQRSAARARSASPRPTCRAAPSSTTGRRAARRPRRCGARSRPPRSPRRRGASPIAARRPLAAQHRVADGAHDVQRLLVAEVPLAAGAGELAGRAGVADVVVAAAARLELTSKTRRSAVCAEPAHRARGELEPVAAALRGSPAAQLALDAAQLRAGRRRPCRPRARSTAPRRRRRGWRRGSPGRAGRRARRGRPAPPARRSRRRSPAARRRSSAARPPQRRSGRAERSASCSRAISLGEPGLPMRLRHQLGELLRAARASGEPSAAAPRRPGGRASR